MDRGLLLAIPFDSVLVRVVIAVSIGACIGHVLYRVSLRSARARFAAAFIPIVGVLTAFGMSLRAPQLPVLMIPVRAGVVLPIPVESGYLDFAPLAMPVLLAGWVTLASALVVLRLVRYGAFARNRASLTAEGSVPAPLYEAVRDSAHHLSIPIPQVVVSMQCRGGAYVAGIRKPCLVVSHALLVQLDADELRAVVAHELAHIARHDLLTALIVGFMRDLLFFIPGRAWTDTSLHRERERAADERAVRITGKPGALASSMLKAAELPQQSLPRGVAALAPQGDFVARIDALLAPRPVSRLRNRLELTAVAVLSAATVVASVMLPTLFRSDAADRDALAVVWSDASATVKLEDSEARVFALYREVAQPTARTTALAVRTHIERQLDNRPSTLQSCTKMMCPSQATAVSLGLTPQIDHTRSSSTNLLRATPLRNDLGGPVRVFWVADSR